MTYTNSDVLRVTARMTRGQDDVQNVFHYLVWNLAAPIDDTTGDNAIVADLDAAYTFLVPVIETGLDFVDIVIQNVTEGTPSRYHNWTTLTSGSDSGTPLPYQVCGLVLFPSVRAKSQGRKFIGGAVEDSSTGEGVPAGAYLTALAAFGTSIITTTPVGTGGLLVGNYDKDEIAFSGWTHFVVATYWATQRRRTVGKGS